MSSPCKNCKRGNDFNCHHCEEAFEYHELEDGDSQPKVFTGKPGTHSAFITDNSKGDDE